MTKQVTAIVPGTRVRSFDFDNQDLTGERACFVEGTVVGFCEIGGCTRYDILVDRRVFGGEDSTRGSERVFPPVNGTPNLRGGVCNGVVAIEGGAA